MTVFNVMTGYGAANNNATNDATAINNAIAAANAAGGGDVYFPAGAGYKINSALTTPVSGVNFKGEGWKKSMIKANFANGDTLTLSGTEGHLIRDLGFFPMVTRASGAEIRIDSVVSPFVQECKVGNDYGTPYVGIHVTGNVNYKVWISNTECNGCSRAGSEIGSSGGGDFPQGVYFWQCEMSAGAIGAIVNSGSGNFYINTEFLANTSHGAHVNRANGASINQLFFDTCLMDSNGGHGIYVTDNGGAGNISDLVIRGTWSATNALKGIYVPNTADVRRLTIELCKVLNNGGDGISAYAAVNTIIRDNDVWSNAQAGYNTGSGIYIEGPAQGVAVDGNFVDAQPYQGNAQNCAYGIYIGGMVQIHAVRSNVSVNHVTGNYQYSSTPTLTADNV